VFAQVSAVSQVEQGTALVDVGVGPRGVGLATGRRLRLRHRLRLRLVVVVGVEDGLGVVGRADDSDSATTGMR